MPEPDAPSRSEPTGARTERYQLPVPVPRVSEAGRDGAGWFLRMLRALFGWKPGSIRADLEVVLEAGAAGETGFSPEERAMLKNILGLRERRVEDVMVPRADIVAVQQDIVLAYETIAREARSQRKPFAHHVAHLAVHGFLHLLGYDHERRTDAEAMERTEREILQRLAVPDPYGHPAKA